MALSLTFAIGLTALAVDVGTLYVARSELQRAADAAAMAAAAELNDSDQPDLEQRVFEQANRYAFDNAILRRAAGLSTSDVVLGHGSYNAGTGKYEFVPGGSARDAVQVTVRREEGSQGGPIGLAFAGIFGQRAKGLSATATAMLVPRDVALVIDLSNSMCWDSQLRFCDRTDGGYANTRDVWCALNGPEPSRPYLPGSELETEYASDSGPTIGVMSNWGSPLVPGYNAGADPGLWYLKKGTSTSLSAIAESLTARGYNAAERSALMSGSLDSDANHWRRRACVILGLASWKSGKPGGFAGGNGDNKLDSGEVSYIAYPSWRVDWTWNNYIDWVQSNSVYNSSGSQYASEFRYRYGLKTFTDFLLENQPESFSTSNLWATPQQPLRAVKDAVQTFIDTVRAQDNLDRVSLEIFATTARHEVNLTDDLQRIADTLYRRQSGHYDRATNIGGGLQKAVAELTSSRARPNAKKMIILMSDGVPNVDKYGNYSYDGAPSAVNWAYEMAEEAASRGIQIFCISVGFAVDRSVMIQIANIGRGEEFYAAGSPEEYGEELKHIFRTLGGKSPVVLIE
jgi:hypothetical protein